MNIPSENNPTIGPTNVPCNKEANGNILPTLATTKINEKEMSPPTAEMTLEMTPNLISDNPGLYGFT